MTREGQLHRGREDPQLPGVAGIVRRQDEHGLREAQLAGDPLHGVVGEPPAVWEDGQGIASEGAVGEDVGGQEAAAHSPLRFHLARPRHLDGLVDAALVLLEVLHEELAELLDFALEVGGTVP